MSLTGFKNRLLFYLSFLLQATVHAQMTGCTDHAASNYDKNAQKNDGSCIYPTTSVTLQKACELSDSLYESSGLIRSAGLFWSHNDGGNEAAIYAFDSVSGKLLHRSFISNASNNDWEDMTEDSDYIYVGDFGNNNGNRKDLCILRILKKDINLSVYSDTLNADFIRFSMADQSNFNPPSQQHDYDMEAMFYYGGNLHLFSKNWSDKASRHYICPADTGTYSLNPIETLSGFGLVTGACINSKKVIAMSGYGTDYKTFIRLIWDCNPNELSQGNKRRFESGNALSPGQTEALVFSGNQLFITAEKALVAQQMYVAELSSYLNDSFRTLALKTQDTRAKVKVSAFTKQSMFVLVLTEEPPDWEIIDLSGKPVLKGKLEEEINKIDIQSLPSGTYVFRAGACVYKFLH